MPDVEKELAALGQMTAGELARLTHVTQPRITQVMQLLHLASDIQEELLFLPPIERGRDRVTEKHLRRIAAEPHW